MTLRFPRLSLLLAALTFVISALPAQGEGQGLQGQLEAQRQKLAKKRKKPVGGEDMETGDDSSRMTPEQLLAARKRRGSRGQCRFVAAMRPEKLLPGQSGTMLVTAILQGRSVLQAPASVTMTLLTKGNLIELGPLAARPAAAGTIHRGFLGRPVYENTAIFEVPVTLANSATLGDKVQVALDLEFDIYDGESTQVVGRFVERVQTQIEVAPASEPQVEPRSERVESEAQAARAAPVAAAAAAAAEVGGSSGAAIAGAASRVADQPVDGPTAAPAAVEPASLPLGSGSAGGGFLLNPMVLGAGGILLVIVVLLLARKR